MTSVFAGTAVRVPSCTWPPARAWSRLPGYPPTPSARRPWSTSPGCSVADIIVYLVSDAAAPVSAAVVPAYGA
jgi:hypothetical protein